MFFGLMCLMALSMRAQRTDTTAGCIDLGLPSGTQWESINITGLFSHDEATKRFGDRLPTKEQWEELKSECRWVWIGSGYKVTGPNGNVITLPAAGCRNCDGVSGRAGTHGYYWSRTPSGTADAWSHYFESGFSSMDNYKQCNGLSVLHVGKR